MSIARASVRCMHMRNMSIRAYMGRGETPRGCTHPAVLSLQDGAPSRRGNDTKRRREHVEFGGDLFNRPTSWPCQERVGYQLHPLAPQRGDSSGTRRGDSRQRLASFDCATGDLCEFTGRGGGPPFFGVSTSTKRPLPPPPARQHDGAISSRAYRGVERRGATLPDWRREVRRSLQVP